MVALRRLAIAHCFWIAATMVPGVSASIAAEPRDVYSDRPTATGPASTHARRQGHPYLVAGQNAAASDRPSWKIAWSQRRNRSNTSRNWGDLNVAQISPTIRRGATLNLEDKGPRACAAKFRRGSAACRAQALRRGPLVDALLEAPSPATEALLKEIGIPAIKDVPPIAILRAGHPRAHGDAADLR